MQKYRWRIQGAIDTDLHPARWYACLSGDCFSVFYARRWSPERHSTCKNFPVQGLPVKRGREERNPRAGSQESFYKFQVVIMIHEELFPQIFSIFFSTG